MFIKMLEGLDDLELGWVFRDDVLNNMVELVS